MTDPKLLSAQSIHEFFRELLSLAIENQRARVHQATELYLANLLSGFLQTESLLVREEDGSLPLLAPTLLYAWLWIALLVFRELTLAVILSSADNVTFPVVVWSLWLGGGLGQASALAIVMLLMMTPLIALYWVIARRQGLVATRV